MRFNFNKKARRKDSVDIKNILFGRTDDEIFHNVVLFHVFKESETFEVRRDIEIPKEDDSDGVVLLFDDGRIGYFKTQSTPLTDEEYESILKVCYFLQDKYGGSIEGYILCRPEIEIRPYKGIERDDITLILTSLRNYDGDEIVEMLTHKLKNKEEFTVQDRIFHILLPYMRYKDREVFLPKYQHYMMETMLNNAEKHGIEVVRL